MVQLGRVSPRLGCWDPQERNPSEENREGSSTSVAGETLERAPAASWRGVACFLIVAAFAAITLQDLFSSDRIPAYRDLLGFVAPFKHFLGEHLRRGEIPLWNPFLYMGTPFLGSLQSGVFYPPSVLLFFPFPLGMNLFLFAHFLIALSGFWLFLRDRGLPLAAVSIGTVTFVLGGYLVSMINVTNNLQASIWAPWVLLFWKRYVEGRSARYLLLTTLVLAMELLGGAPELLLLTLIVIVAWTLFVTLPGWLESLRLGSALATALLMVAGLTAFQILPTWEYIGESSRTGALPLQEVTTWSLQPVSLVQLFLPHSTSLDSVIGIDPRQLSLESLEPWIRSIYLGLIPLCLAIAGAFAGRERRLWGMLILATTILALGRHTPVLPLLYRAVPQLFGKFRYPEKFVFVAHLSACVLAAEGAAAWIRGDRRAERAACAAAVTFIVIAEALVRLRWLLPGAYLQLVAHMSGTFAPMESYVPMAANLVFKAQRVPLILGGFLALFVLRRMSLVRPVILSALLPLLVGADLASIHYDLNSSISWPKLREQHPLVDVNLLRETHGRLFLYQTVSAPLPDMTPQPVDGLESWMRINVQASGLEQAISNLWRVLYLNTPMIERVGTLSGGDGIVRSSDNTLRTAISVVPRDLAVKLVRIFGAAYLVGPVPLEVAELERIPRPSPFFVYRVKHPLPAVRLVSRLVIAASDLGAFNEMIKPTFRPETDATVKETPPGWKNGEGQAGEVSVESWTDEHLKVRVHAEHTAAFLVLNDSFFPGWEARVDGVPTRIFRTNVLVRGLVVGQGDHVVEFSYRPFSFVLGTWISLLSLGGMIIFAWTSRSTHSRVRHALSIA